MTARAALVAALLVVAGSTLAVAWMNPVGAQSAVGGDPPEEVEDGATFTVSTESITLHGGGTICAKKLRPDVNRVTITDATMNGVELYLGDEENPKKVTAPTAEVDEVVLYTNGENSLVDLLATTGRCIPLDQPQQTVLEVYYQHSGTLQMSQFRMVTAGNDTAPEPGGLTLPDSVLNNASTNESAGPATDATDSVENATDGVQDPTGSVTGAVDRADRTLGNATETADGVEDPTGTVTNATDRLNETGGGATTPVENPTDAVEDAGPAGDGAANGTTETVNDTTDAVENTTDDVADTVEDTTDTVEDTTGTVSDTTNTVEDTATAGKTTVQNVLPTAGFSSPVDVPTVGQPVTLSAENSEDPDGNIRSYEWDVDGDGNFERTGREVTHAFSTAGDRKVTLRVTDDDGATDKTTRTIAVNAPPEAAFAVLTDLLTIGSPIDLDASKSTDPDGQIAKYEWDLDGDGDFEGTGATPSPTFSDLGEHTIGLRVTDDDGATDTTERTIDLVEDGGLLGGSTTTEADDSTTTSGGSTDDGDTTTDDDGISGIGALSP